MGLIILPVVTILVLPPAALGGYAASRRSSLTSGSFASSAEDIESGDLSLVDVSGALRSPDAMRALVRRAGEDVDFTGFVTKDSGMAANEFTLNRFLITCCVADALSAEVRVIGAPPGEFKTDEWVRVEGQVYPVGKEVIVDASDIKTVKRPKHPYLGS
jgi:putative membrane protein